MSTVSTDETCDALGVNFLTANPKPGLLSTGSSFLLFSNHNMNFFGFDVLPNMPGCQPVFVLLFPARLLRQGCHSKIRFDLSKKKIRHKTQNRGFKKKKKKKKKKGEEREQQTEAPCTSSSTR
jgi:hypothetical protein